MKHEVKLPHGDTVPALGIGTWHTAETGILRQNEREIDAIKTGLDAGMRFIDTAEMYSNGDSESLISKALQKSPISRDKIFLTSKVYPWNAGEKHITESCKASLKRLGTDCLDLYLLHWRGTIPLEETVQCMEDLIQQGLIRSWGVSNFDVEDMEDLWSVPNGTHCQVDEVLYHVASRGIEYSLMPWLREHRVPTVAYCPLAQGGTLPVGNKSALRDPTLLSIAQKHQATTAQIMLAWSIRDGATISIPMSSQPEHVLQNADADGITLDADDLARIDEAFPAPTQKVDLATQ